MINHPYQTFALLFSILLVVCTSCTNSSGREDSRWPFELVPSEYSGVKFENTLTDTEDFNIFLYRNFYNGAGTAIGDLNNDGLPEVFFTSNMGCNTLYLNKGKFQFEDITKRSGVICRGKWGTGVEFVDINADGWLDIYVCYAGFQKGVDQRNELYINNHDMTFTERAREYNLDENGYTTHASFFDYDKDGDLDVYILNNSFMPVNTLDYSNKRELPAEEWPVKDYLKGGGDRLMRNDHGTFVDVSKESGIYNSLIGFGLGITIGDVDNDGWEDIYVSNDFFERDYLYVNQRNGTFKECIKDRMNHISAFSMGADMGDLNNDTYPEIFVTDMLPDNDYRVKTNTAFEDYKTHNLKLSRDFYHQYMQNTLQLNNGNGSFSEIARFSGVAASDWSWGALLVDINNDGFRDIYVSNGIYHDVTNQDFIDFFANDAILRMALTGKKVEVDKIVSRMPSTPLRNKVFISRGDLTFDDVSNAPQNLPSFSNGTAYGDLDDDGDVDMVVNNVNQECFLLKNNTDEKTTNHFVKFNLKGTDKNVFAIGATIRVHAGGQTYSSQLVPSRGFQSSVDYQLVFGLGKSGQIDSVVVQWNDHTYSLLKQLPADSTYTITKTNTSSPVKLREPVIAPLMSEVSNIFGEHTEDKFVDFYNERLLIKMLSKEGPKAAVADINSDGLDDLFICGALGQSGKLYIQTKDGFNISQQPHLERDSTYEGTACHFFDADADGDLDLFVGTGGNHSHLSVMSMQDRLYLNDGKGTFILHTSALPNNGYNTSVVLSFDFDSDGDLDLFVGSRSIPTNYGPSPKNFLYQNKGDGTFSNVIHTIAPELEFAGMVTDATLSDQDGDGKQDLVVVGDWMNPMIFSFKDGTMQRIESVLDDYKGWWGTVTAVDLDGDGLEDLVLGNRGENFYFTASKDRPAKLWLSDFDNNGSTDPIPTYTVDGRDVTIHNKKDLIQQITILAKQNLKHSEFASKGITDLFPDEVISKAVVKEANYFKSIVAIQKKAGDYQVVELPAEVQYSSIRAIAVIDVDGDSKKDLLLGGNDENFLPQFAKLDASYGTTVLNREDCLVVMPSRQSGFFVRGSIRQLVPIKIGGEMQILCLLNNKTPKLFKLRSSAK